GGLIAGTLFILPGIVAIMALSWVYAAFGSVGAIAAIFFGLKAAVIAIVLEAVRRIGRRALAGRAMWGIAILAFVAIAFLSVPFPILGLAAAAAGSAGARLGLAGFARHGEHDAVPGGVQDGDTALGDAIPDHARSDWRRTLGLAA